MKKFIIAAFLAILYLPLGLAFVAEHSNYSCDVPLKGYTDTVQKPKLTASTFWDGSYQNGYTAWYEANLKPRGVLTKTYATIQYNCFDLGNRTIGKNGDIFEMGYINDKLCINGSADYSNTEHWLEMSEYVDKLQTLQEKLEKFGKYLYVYIAPSKADFNYDNIPDKYTALGSSDAVRGVDAFRQLIAQTDVPYFICADVKGQLRYPAFYHSGIHWSRTFEQETSAYLLKEFAQVTGKNYRNILLSEEAKASSTPYWRDADVYDLLNVWNKPNETYYEYIAEAEVKENYDKIKILLQGDSFGKGLRKDILDLYPFENYYHINYDESWQDKNGREYKIDSWDSLNFAKFLDGSDIVVIEAAETNIRRYSCGFVDYLIDFLDNYEPGSSDTNYVKELNLDSDEAWHSDSLYGMYDREKGFVWAKSQSQIILDNSNLKNAGLELDFSISDELFRMDKGSEIVDIIVNGTKLVSREFHEAWEGSIIIAPDELEKVADGNLYEIEIHSSKAFRPSELGNSPDDRELAIVIKYVGEAR